MHPCARFLWSTEKPHQSPPQPPLPQPSDEPQPDEPQPDEPQSPEVVQPDSSLPRGRCLRLCQAAAKAIDTKKAMRNVSCQSTPLSPPAARQATIRNPRAATMAAALNARRVAAFENIQTAPVSIRCHWSAGEKRSLGFGQMSAGGGWPKKRW